MLRNFLGRPRFDRGPERAPEPEAVLLCAPIEAAPIAPSQVDHQPAPPPSDDEVSQNIIALSIEYDRFSDRLTRELGKVGGLFGKLSSDHQVLTRRFDALSGEHAAARDALVAAHARNEAFGQDNSRLQADIATAAARVERAQANHHAVNEQYIALQLRHEAREAEHNRVLNDLDRHQNELIGARHDLNDMTQKLEQARVQVEQARIREASLDARSRLLAVNAEGDRAESERVAKTVVEHAETIHRLINELQVARERIATLEAAREALITERDRVASDLAGKAMKLEEARRTADARIEGLTRTKDFLWQTSEKQRRQLADQASRIAQLEQSNTKLSQLLTESGKFWPRDVAENEPMDLGDEAPRAARLQQLQLEAGLNAANKTAAYAPVLVQR